MGTTTSKLGGELQDDEHYFGLDNFGNTCYVNSVVQSLYYCNTFRKRVLDDQLKQQPVDVNNMLTSLADLFQTLNSQKRKTGSIAPKKFVEQLRCDNELFKSNMHQDAQEFLVFLLNALVENLQKAANNKTDKKPNDGVETTKEADPKKKRTWVHDIFEGVMTNETRCICCEHTSSREESFFDLSIDVSQNSSLTHCLNNFSSVETLRGNNKFHCDRCNSLQEAQKSMKIKKLPQVMAIQLKRFKYSEEIRDNKKLSYRVAFPFELKMCNTSQECISDPDTPYELFAVVIHVGSGPNHGHYKSVVKSCGKWLLFDDDLVDIVDDKFVKSLHGFSNDFNGTSETGYILFYRSITQDNKEEQEPKKNEEHHPMEEK